MGLLSWWYPKPEEPAPPPPPEPPRPEDNIDPENYRDKLKGRGSYTQFYDPCAAAAKASMECMNRNDFDREACADYFQAYRECKKTWMDQKTIDRRKGMNVS